MTRQIVGAVLAVLLVPLLARSAPQNSFSEALEQNASQGGGAVIESYLAKQRSDSPYTVTTVRILNRSNKDITAIAIAIRVQNLVDGTLGPPGTVVGQDLLEQYISGDKPFPPGAVFNMDVTQTGPITAQIALVVYADKTAEVTDNDMYRSIIADRAGQAKAMQEINDILSAALEDPSIDPVQKLDELLASTDDTVSAGYRLEIKTALQNLNGRDQQAAMRAVMAGNQKRLPIVTEHSQLINDVAN